MLTISTLLFNLTIFVPVLPVVPVIPVVPVQPYVPVPVPPPVVWDQNAVNTASGATGTGYPSARRYHP